jgi:hypothetical protein
MADDFTGTNSDKIDKLITAVVELRATLRTTIRITAGILAIGVPALIAFGAYLVVSIRDAASGHPRDSCAPRPH